MFFAMQILSVVDPFENQLCAERAIHPMNGKNKYINKLINILLVTLTGTKFLIETHETPVYQTIVVTILT